MTILYVSLRMLLHRRARVVATVLGLAALFFLSAFQVDVFVGWCDTTLLLVRHAAVDVWVMAEYTPALEYGSPIPKHRIEQVRDVPGVAWAEAMHLSSSVWRRDEAGGLRASRGDFTAGLPPRRLLLHPGRPSHRPRLRLPRLSRPRLQESCHRRVNY